MQELRDLGNPVRVGFIFLADNFDKLQAAGIRTRLGDDRLRVTSLKTFQGNSLSGRTAWLSEAYSDRTGYFGIPPARLSSSSTPTTRSGGTPVGRWLRIPTVIARSTWCGR